MHWLLNALEFIRHLDRYLNDIAAAHPIGVYGLLAAIIFCETGLVVTPLLPGDSLLFAIGTLAAAPNSPMRLEWIIPLLCLAANSGDLVNYAVGYRLGPAVFRRESSWLLNKRHLTEANEFYLRHGRKTIIMARFVPIIRTFAPFVAGIGRMPFSRFIGFSIGGGAAWVSLMILAGWRLGTIPVVHDHFEVAILGIVAVSLIPVVIQTLRSRRQDRH